MISSKNTIEGSIYSHKVSETCSFNLNLLLPKTKLHELFAFIMSCLFTQSLKYNLIIN